MELGLFFMPVHRPEKPWQVALEEDRQAALLADRTGYSEVWMGEHFSTKVEQVPSPLMFLATLIHETQTHQLWNRRHQPRPSPPDRRCRGSRSIRSTQLGAAAAGLVDPEDSLATPNYLVDRIWANASRQPRSRSR